MKAHFNAERTQWDMLRCLTWAKKNREYLYTLHPTVSHRVAVYLAGGPRWPGHVCKWCKRKLKHYAALNEHVAHCPEVGGSKIGKDLKARIWKLFEGEGEKLTLLNIVTALLLIDKYDPEYAEKKL